MGDTALLAGEALDCAVIDEVDAFSLGKIGERIGELEAVARLVIGQAQTTHDRLATVRKAWLSGDAACAIEHLELYAVCLKDGDILGDAVELILFSEQLESAPAALAIGDAG